MGQRIQDCLNQKLLALVSLMISEIDERYDTMDNLLPRSSSFFALLLIWGSLVSAVAYFLSLKARISVSFQQIWKDLGL